jgi:predicted nucleic-acid-binding protein
MRAVDTNVLVRLIVRDNLPQLAAAEEFIQSGAWISQLVLAESVWVLDYLYGFNSDRLATAISMLLDHESLSMQDVDVVNRALELFRAKPGLGFSDCLILEIARKNGHMPLGTFDRKLARVEGARKL